jgi:hypothetical protein
MAGGTAERLVGAELTRLLVLLRDVDSLELKLTVPDVLHRSTIAALGLDPLKAQIRQVFFLDTPDLALNEVGMVARVRRVRGRESDAVVKLRPVVPAELAPALRRSPQFCVEVDAMPGGYVCSASLKGKLPPDAVLKSVWGDEPLSSLFSAEQRGFFAAHAPPGLTIDELSVLGPIFVLKLKLPKATFSRRIVAEMWLYPDGSRILELSTKCLPDEGMGVAVGLRQLFEGKGIEISDQQQTKTRTALEFFAAERAGRPTPGAP